MTDFNRFAPRMRVEEKTSFTWSYSKLKNFETCELKHFKVDLSKEFEEVPGPQLAEGNRFHDAMKVCVNSGAPLPDEFKKQQKYLELLTKVTDPFQIIQTELKLAITRELKPCGYFARDVWFRGIIDYLKFVPVKENQICLAVDYKTGRMLDDAVQLALFAQLVFSHHPNTLIVRTDYLWTQDDCFTREDFKPADMLNLWTVLGPRVAAMESAYNTGQYKAKKSGICKKHCPVTTCVHNGSYA